MSRFILAALLLVTGEAEAATRPADGAWRCRFHSSYECAATGCRKTKPPAYQVFFNWGYMRCFPGGECRDEPKAVVTKRPTGLQIDLPAGTAVISLARNKLPKLTEATTRAGNIVTSFASCVVPEPQIITRTLPPTQ